MVPSRTCFSANGSIIRCSRHMRRIHLSLLIMEVPAESVACLTEFTGAFCHGLGSRSRRHSSGAPQGRRSMEFPYPPERRPLPDRLPDLLLEGLHVVGLVHEPAHAL